MSNIKLTIKRKKGILSVLEQGGAVILGSSNLIRLNGDIESKSINIRSSDGGDYYTDEGLWDLSESGLESALNNAINIIGRYKDFYEDHDKNIKEIKSLMEDNAPASVNEIQEALEEHISAMKKLINDTMASKGDTGEECQRQHLLNQIMLMEQAVNGISDGDMKNATEDGIRNYSGNEKGTASHYGCCDAPDSWLGA